MRRVHAVRVVEGVLRRPFGLASAAGRGRRLRRGGGRRAHAVPAAAARRGRSRSWPSCCPSWPTSRAGSSRRRRARARRYVLPPTRRRPGRGRRAPACSAPRIAPWPLLVAPLLALDGWLDYRAAGWRLRDGRLAMRSRRLAWSTLLTPAARLQQHVDRAEPAAAPRPPGRPRGRGRQGRPRAASATSRRRSPPSCGSGCGDDERVLLRRRLALRLPHGRAAPARRRGVEADLARRAVEAERRRVVGADRPPRGGDRRDRGARRALRAAADPLAGPVARPLPERDARLPGRRRGGRAARSSPASRRAWASPRAATCPR